LLAPGEHPFPVARAMTFDAMYVETPRFMAELAADYLRGGGRIRMRRFADLSDVATLPEALVFNCTGVGARALVGDEGLVPVRGQLAVLAPQADVQYAFAGTAGYMFPRKDGVLLGGTFERNEWEATPQPRDIAKIVASHKRLFEGFRCTA
jgi:D-amino-acid oxidase